MMCLMMGHNGNLWIMKHKKQRLSDYYAADTQDWDTAGYYASVPDAEKPNYIAKVNRCLRSYQLDATDQGYAIAKRFVQDKALVIHQHAPTYGWLCRFIWDRHWKLFLTYLKENQSLLKN
jgi:GH43 family beta-xylosidase